GNARHHGALLEGWIFVAQPRVRVHAALGPRLLRHRAAGRGTLFARSPDRRGAMIPVRLPPVGPPSLPGLTRQSIRLLKTPCEEDGCAGHKRIHARLPTRYARA